VRKYLFLRGEVIDDVEELADLLWALSLDHVGDSLTAYIAVKNASNTPKRDTKEDNRTEAV
jgi:hypothetical protein